MEQLFFFNHQVILYYIYIYIYIYKFSSFPLWFFAPVLGKMEAGCLVLWSAEGRLSWQGFVYEQMAGNSVELPGSSVPKERHFCPPHGPTLTSKNHFLPHSPRERVAQQGPLAATPGLPFPLTYVRSKNARFSKRKTTKIKAKAQNKPSAWKSLWVRCPKVRGTLPEQSLL